MRSWRRGVRKEWIVGSEAYLITNCFVCLKELGMSIKADKDATAFHKLCLDEYGRRLVQYLRETANEELIHVRDHPSTLQPTGHRGLT